MGTESPSIVCVSRATSKSARWRVFALIYICFLLMIVAVGLFVSSWMQTHVKHSLQDEITRNLIQKARLVANRISADRAHGIEVIASQEGLAAGARATVIDSNGQVVADSEVPISSLENEGRSPEFAAALRGITGTEIRNRNGAEVLFVAVPVSGGAVRLAYPISDVSGVTAQLSSRILWCFVPAALVGLIVCGAIARLIPLD